MCSVSTATDCEGACACVTATPIPRSNPEILSRTKSTSLHHPALILVTMDTYISAICAQLGVNSNDACKAVAAAADNGVAGSGVSTKELVIKVVGSSSASQFVDSLTSNLLLVAHLGYDSKRDCLFASQGKAQPILPIATSVQVRDISAVGGVVLLRTWVAVLYSGRTVVLEVDFSDCLVLVPGSFSPWSGPPSRCLSDISPEVRAHRERVHVKGEVLGISPSFMSRGDHFQFVLDLGNPSTSHCVFVVISKPEWKFLLRIGNRVAISHLESAKVMLRSGKLRVLMCSKDSQLFVDHAPTQPQPQAEGGDEEVVGAVTANDIKMDIENNNGLDQDVEEEVNGKSEADTSEGEDEGDASDCSPRPTLPNFDPHLVHYRGVITQTLSSDVFEMDGSFYLFASHRCQRDAFPVTGLRNGAHVVVRNAHVLRVGGQLKGICCCSYSSVEVTHIARCSVPSTFIRHKLWSNLVSCTSAPVFATIMLTVRALKKQMGSGCLRPPSSSSSSASSSSSSTFSSTFSSSNSREKPPQSLSTSDLLNSHKNLAASVVGRILGRDAVPSMPLQSVLDDFCGHDSDTCIAGVSSSSVSSSSSITVLPTLLSVGDLVTLDAIKVATSQLVRGEEPHTAPTFSSSSSSSASNKNGNTYCKTPSHFRELHSENGLLSGVRGEQAGRVYKVVGELQYRGDEGNLVLRDATGFVQVHIVGIVPEAMGAIVVFHRFSVIVEQFNTAGKSIHRYILASMSDLEIIKPPAASAADPNDLPPHLRVDGQEHTVRVTHIHDPTHRAPFEVCFERSGSNGSSILPVISMDPSVTRMHPFLCVGDILVVTGKIISGDGAESSFSNKERSPALLVSKLVFKQRKGVEEPARGCVSVRDLCFVPFADEENSVEGNRGNSHGKGQSSNGRIKERMVDVHGILIHKHLWSTGGQWSQVCTLRDTNGPDTIDIRVDRLVPGFLPGSHVVIRRAALGCIGDRLTLRARPYSSIHVTAIGDELDRLPQEPPRVPLSSFQVVKSGIDSRVHVFCGTLVSVSFLTLHATCRVCTNLAPCMCSAPEYRLAGEGSIVLDDGTAQAKVYLKGHHCETFLGLPSLFREDVISWLASGEGFVFQREQEDSAFISK